jgi:hypothetical protein
MSSLEEGKHEVVNETKIGNPGPLGMSLISIIN